MAEVYFSCNQCGKCCSEAPNVSLYDMLELSDCFVWQTSHNAFLSYSNNPIQKDRALHLQSFGHTIMAPEFDTSMFYYIDFSPFEIPSIQRCSQLGNDNLCSIYGRRPVACKLSPLSINNDESNQMKTIDFYQQGVLKNGWKCDFNSNKLIYSKKEISNQASSNLFYQELMTTREFTDKFLDYLTQHGEEYKNNHLKNLYQASTKREHMVSDILFALQISVYNGIISPEYAIKIIQNQLSLIQNGITYMTTNKNKIDLLVNRNYKTIKEHYENVLKSDLFKQSFDFNLI